MTASPIWKSETALMNRLTTAQNHPVNSNIDIMTFAGWCGSREALEAHVDRYEEYALVADIAAIVSAQYGPKRRPRNHKAA